VSSVLPLGLAETSGQVATHHLIVPCAPRSFLTETPLSQGTSLQIAATPDISIQEHAVLPDLAIRLIFATGGTAPCWSVERMQVVGHFWISFAQQNWRLLSGSRSGTCQNTGTVLKQRWSWERKCGSSLQSGLGCWLVVNQSAALID